jgi:hypothetical protein
MEARASTTLFSLSFRYLNGKIKLRNRLMRVERKGPQQLFLLRKAEDYTTTGVGKEGKEKETKKKKKKRKGTYMKEIRVSFFGT